MIENNQKIAKIFYEISELLDIKGITNSKAAFRMRAYRKAADFLQKMNEDVFKLYKKQGLKGLEDLPIIGKSIAKKIEEYIKTGKIKYYKDLDEDTKIKQIVTYYFKSKGLTLNHIKNDARKKKIVYSRHTKPAKQLLELAGSIEKAKSAIDKVAKWANSRKLDYAIETVFKKWLELDRLKPKEIVKKPFFQDKPMVWSETKKKFYVIEDTGEWLEFAGEEKDIEWRIIK